MLLSHYVGFWQGLLNDIPESEDSWIELHEQNPSFPKDSYRYRLKKLNVKPSHGSYKAPQGSTFLPRHPL